MEPKHVSVLLQECIDALNIKPDGIYVDGTLGMGGHSSEIAARLTTGRLIGIDRDESAIRRAGERLKPFGERVQLVHGNFRDTAAILDSLGITGVDGMLFDLGVSSPQLDEAERGFSYMHDAPLDMRMDTSDDLSAWFVVNRWPEEKLKRILYDYGEERYAPRIAAAIVRAREQKPLTTTFELVDVIRSAMPAQALREKQHPAKRSFQAIRIAVNDELEAVRTLMETAPDKLNVGGFPRVHLRFRADAEKCHAQACCPVRRRTRIQSPRPQRKAACGGARITETSRRKGVERIWRRRNADIMQTVPWLMSSPGLSRRNTFTASIRRIFRSLPSWKRLWRRQFPFRVRQFRRAL